ncbi:MAG TPA: type VI secretion system baseplate subunit TssK [Granulicella sp.]|nr:type VI secretion system baseplate subunit TssK [Granulicella sp.]
MTTKLLDLPELIEWHEGMLLTPQHFQQLSARGELLTQFLTTVASPFGWGVIDLKIDEAALSGGILGILNVEAILPDGLLARSGSERGEKLELNLQTLNRTDNSPVRVYLTVPRDSALYNRSEYSRYQQAVRPDEQTPDQVSGGDTVTIPRITPRMTLESDPAKLAGKTVLPLIEFTGHGTVFRQTEYIAPILRIKAGSPLSDLCAALSSMIRSIATDLAAKLSPSGGGGDPEKLRQLHWLVSELPVFESLLDNEQTHPYTAYLALCSMAGSISLLSHARVPAKFPPYNHDDLRASFQIVIASIQRALSEGLTESWIHRDFSLAPEQRAATDSQPQRSERTYEIAPSLEAAFGDEADFSAQSLALMVRLPTGMTPDTMTAWGESCVLAREDAINDLELSRSKGAVCERVYSLDDLIAPPGSVLFRVYNDSKWIAPGKKLVLKPARQETVVPDAVTLFVKKSSQKNKGA